MFATIKQIFNSNNKDLRKKILFTLMCLFIFKLGTTIVVPVINKDALGVNSLGFLQLLNVMGGGALEKFSIFSLGVMPYITASIIMQLLEMDIIPYFTELSKEGYTGRAKLNMYTRIFGIILAFVQGYIFSFNYVSGASIMTYVECATILTAGTAFLLWIGDRITEKGVGNGISLLIMAGSLSSLPSMFYRAWGDMVGVTMSAPGIIKFVIFVIVYFAIVVGIVYEELAERRIPIQYANRSTGTMMGNSNYIPFKLNSASVIPVIFASALITIPSVIAALIKNAGFTSFVNNYINYTSVTGFILYVAVIILFSYFYTFLELKPDEMVENLQKNGGYIPGIRPGDETLKFIKSTLYRLTFVGSLGLSLLAALPIIFGNITNLSSSVTIGGTGLLIVVGVALETYKQIESLLVTRSYTRVTRR